MKWVKGIDRAEFVWTGDPRDEISDGSVRKLKMLQASYYPCRFCKTNHVCKVEGTVCEDCLHSDDYKKTLKDTSDVSFRYKSYKDVVAFGVDKVSGKPIAITKDGRRVDEADTIYAKSKNDPHGWKATGKRVSHKSDYGKS